MKEAVFYKKLNGKVQCILCPHECLINEGKRGSCRVRKNEGGKLISENYNRICSYNFDPVEKKPLYHFFPGRTIFSVGSIGCNLHCQFCQNWEISQSTMEEHPTLNDHTAEEIVKVAIRKSDNIGIAFTYNEPTVWYEYMLDIAKLAKAEKLRTAMVTNGFIQPEPLTQLLPFIDAFSVDLKAFTENFYKKYTASRLEPVLNTLKLLKSQNKHIEITNLVITEINDGKNEFKTMVDWIADQIGEDTVFHISRYFPMYKLAKDPTSIDTLTELFDIAVKRLKYVYLGNVRTGEGQDTYCKSCGKVVIERSGYHTKNKGLSPRGHCLFCKEQIIAKNCI
jgi:pyruvate formate lyase activating enzyme